MSSPQDPFATPPGSGQPPQSPYGQPADQQPPPYEQQQYGAPAYGQQPGAPAYGQQPYGQPAYETGRQGPPRNGLGIAALVLGVLGLLTSWLVVGGLLGIVAIVLGFIGRGRAKRGEATNGGMALAGIITGALAVLVAALVVVGAVALFNTGEFGSYTECIQQSEGQSELEECNTEFQDSVPTD
ncbi:hypothetical protein BH24ACT10_BH24ACT10_01640 [soil metagenome]